MGTADKIHVVFLQEARDDIRAKGERDTTIVLTPPGDVLIWVGPQEIAKQTAVGDISGSHDTADLLHRVEVGTKTTVHGKDLLVNNGGNGETVEAVGKCLPELDVVATLALVVETIDTVDGGTLVVATEDEEVLGVLDLVGEQQADGLQGLLASVDIITEEEVVGLGGESTVLKQPEQVIVLPVNITADLDGSFKLKKDGLRNEDLASLGAKIANLGLEQLDLLARSAAPHFQEAIDYRVKVDFVLVRHCKYSSILTSLRLWRTQKKKKTELLVVTGRSQAVRDRTGKKTASALENRSDDALLGAITLQNRSDLSNEWL